MITSVVLLIIAAALPAGIAYARKNPQFGGSVTAEEKKRFENSMQWRGDIFENSSTTTMDMNLKTVPGLLKEFINGRKSRMPKTSIDFHEFDRERFEKGSKPRFIWFGHSVALLRIDSINILIDPMFGPDASPIGPMRTKRFSDNTLDIIDSLPEIDLVLLTHDHYDHLDYQSILKLKNKVKCFYVALGTARHLIKWGISKDRIQEFDWWQKTVFQELEIVFTPSRHFSGRGAFDRAKSLWGGWVVKSKEFSVYWSGDGGYDSHFKEIGMKYGPFDLGFMECGQYNERWQQIHMLPEEAVQASMDASVNKAIPVHWGAFSLALHDWKDPIQRFEKQAQLDGQDCLFPELGKVIKYDENHSEPWWERIDY